MQIKINKRSAYAPIRYEATRPYAVALGKAFMAESVKGESARMDFVGGKLLQLIKVGIAKMGQERGPGPLQAEIVNVQLFGSYCSGGKIIFDISKILSQTLMHTDAEDIPCGELVFPAEGFYLYFGPDVGLMEEGFPIEGAFVKHYGDRMVIDLVAHGFGQAHFLSLPMGERTTGVHVKLNDPQRPLTVALDEGIADIVESNAKMKAQIAQIERQLEQQYGQVVKVPSPVESLAEKGPLLHKALGLIVNTMFYLAAEPEDVEEDWERGTPTEALDALRAATKPNVVKNLESNLRNARYTKVRFVGRQFSRSIAGQLIQDAQSSGKKLAMHFRRGHFRRQHYGPERALLKRIFVAPVVVNAGAGVEPAGRIYDVRP